MSHSVVKYYISVLPCLFISWYLISVLHLAFQDLVNNISMTNPDQPAVLSFFPKGCIRQGHLSSYCFQLMLHCNHVPVGGYFKQPKNCTANGGGLTWCCHSQCLRPPSLHCQELGGCHGYPQSFCHRP